MSDKSAGEILDEVEARANAATEGSWATTFGPHEPARVWGADSDAEPIAVLGGYVEDSDAKADAEFIAHARTDLPALVAALRAVLELADAADAAAADDPDQECGLVHTHQVRAAITSALGGAR